MRRASDGRIYVAGLEFAQNQGDSSAAADWLFSQGEVYIKGGTVRWTDEQRGAPELALEKVDLVCATATGTTTFGWMPHRRRNGATVSSLVRSVSRAAAARSRWQLETLERPGVCPFRVDVSRLRHHADVGIEVAQGRGALRAWADVRSGQVGAARPTWRWPM